MSLTNIEYGSLANSETLNKNFSYLENKIDEAFNSTMTSISSILSNIATINTRLSEQTEMVENNSQELSSKLDEYKNKTKIFIQKSSNLPAWNGITQIDLSNKYSVSSNGYLLIIPQNGSTGSININNTNIEYTNSTVALLPVKDGDSVTSNIILQKAYFIPATSIIFDNF